MSDIETQLRRDAERKLRSATEELGRLQDRIEELEDRAEMAEAKLARAARFVSYIAGQNTDHVRVALAGNPTVCAEICSEASATLAEITGGGD